jgi:YHS domain-containing protein
MKKILTVLIALASTITTFAQTKTIDKNVNTQNGVAIQGYDPVAYFEVGKAVKGIKDISTNFQEAIYYFSTEEHKTSFLKNPMQYIPQFGGYCAYGMSEGYNAPISPEAFTIVNNQLYLNYNLKVRETWLKDRDKRIEKATKNWTSN